MKEDYMMKIRIGDIISVNMTGMAGCPEFKVVDLTFGQESDFIGLASGDKRFKDVELEVKRPATHNHTPSQKSDKEPTLKGFYTKFTEREGKHTTVPGGR